MSRGESNVQGEPVSSLSEVRAELLQLIEMRDISIGQRETLSEECIKYDLLRRDVNIYKHELVIIDFQLTSLDAEIITSDIQWRRRESNENPKQEEEDLQAYKNARLHLIAHKNMLRSNREPIEKKLFDGWTQLKIDGLSRKIHYTNLVETVRCIEQMQEAIDKHEIYIKKMSV